MVSSLLRALAGFCWKPCGVGCGREGLQARSLGSHVSRIVGVRALEWGSFLQKNRTDLAITWLTSALASVGGMLLPNTPNLFTLTLKKTHTKDAAV